MADKKSLSDLGELTNAKPEAPAVAEAPAETAAADAPPKRLPTLAGPHQVERPSRPRRGG